MKPETFSACATLPNRVAVLLTTAVSRLGATLAVTIGLLWSLAQVQATSYYVDFAAGSDSRAGTSKDTAWKRCPGDEAATGVAAGTSLKPGDVVYFKGGVVYIGGITISASGQAGQEIILDGNHSGSWGAGRAVIDRNYVPRACISGTNNASHLIIRGFELRNSGGYADTDPILTTTEPLITTPPGGSAMAFETGTHKALVFENIYINRIGQWRNRLPFSGTNSVTGVGIAVQNCNGVLIKDCELTQMRIGISIKSTTTISNITVDSCDIHDYIMWGIDVSPRKSGAVLENISIINTAVRDYHQFDRGNWLGGGEKPHTDGIFLRSADLFSVWKNVNVANCFFYTDNPGLSQGGTASVFITHGASVNVFNNLFVKDPHSRAIGIGHPNPAGMDNQIVRVYNNTFIEGPSQILMAGEANPDRRAVYIQNNIFVRNISANSVMVNHQSGVLPRVLDNNLYWSNEFGYEKKLVAYLGGYKTLQQLQSMGYEKNGRFSDPGFSIPSGVLAKDLNLQPVSSSEVRFGANLSEFFTFDRNGSQRPNNGTWDVGAYLARSGAPPPLSKPKGYLAPNPRGTN